MSASLILAVCMLGSPSNCHDEPLNVSVTFMECAMLGQSIAQEWLEEHPKYRLVGYRCAIGDQGRAA